ncbi:MAG: NIPSNAP family protein, partial [Rhodobacter sp.]|nr:NIPSNAP family protein [Rhodobacter sp.]
RIPPMIYDHRTYSCHPGKIRSQLALYHEFGWPAQTRHLGQPVVFAATETGDVNSYVHIWVYKDAADRAEKRAGMMADPDWIDYLRRSSEAGYLLSQKNAILTPVPFFEGT